MNSTRVDVLVDTNVLVYTYATAEPDKRARALETLDSLVLHGRGRISTQVLGEVFRVVTAKLRPRRNPGDALGDITTLARAWPVLPITPLVVLEAARGVRDHGLNYWDAQLWATARLNQIPLILSEDFAHGSVLEGVTFFDPFSHRFQPAPPD
jgi:predicted nucleic acid-binding protein